MMNGRHVFLVIMLLLTTACSGDDNVPKVEQTKSPGVIQEKVDSFLQPRINVLEKAKGLEGKLKEAEEKRRNTIEGFEGNGR